jgi:hypothetical protein
MFTISHQLASNDILDDSDINVESLLDNHFLGSVCFDSGNGQVIESRCEGLPLLAFSKLLLDACGYLYENSVDEVIIEICTMVEGNKIHLRDKGANRIEISAPFTDVVIETGFKGFLRMAERFNEKLVLDIWHRYIYGRGNKAREDFYSHHFLSPLYSVTRTGVIWDSYV